MKKRFDVLLAYNNRNDAQAIGDDLKNRGLKLWIDTEQLPEGALLKDIIPQIIPKVKFVAIIVSSEEQEIWQPRELELLNEQCQRQEIPLILVLLPGVDKLPPNLTFIKYQDYVNSIRTLSEILDDFEKRILDKPLSLSSKIGINVVIFISLTVIGGILFFFTKLHLFFFISFFFTGLNVSCVSPRVSILLQSVILWLFLHPSCRIFNKFIYKAFGPTLGPVRIKELALLLESIDPWQFSDRNLLMLSFFLSAIVCFVYPKLVFLFPAIDEEIPKIQSVSVYSLEFSTEQTFTVNDIRIIENQPVEIVAQLSPSSTSNLARSQCIWTSDLRGELQSSGKCSALYTAPSGETFDTLAVRIQSPCKTEETLIILSVNVIKP